MKNFVEQI